MDNTEKLLRMKNKIQEATKEKDILQGKMMSLEEKILDDHGCNTIQEAEDKIGKMGVELAEKKSKFNEIIEKLETGYNW